MKMLRWFCRITLFTSGSVDTITPVPKMLVLNTLPYLHACTHIIRCHGVKNGKVFSSRLPSVKKKWLGLTAIVGLDLRQPTHNAVVVGIVLSLGPTGPTTLVENQTYKQSRQTIILIMLSTRL
jgi:hypothetical protein